MQKVTKSSAQGVFRCAGECKRSFEDYLPPLWVNLWPQCWRAGSPS